ncbi:GGDEF domain-containing protein [Azorhizobium doebereinerae]|uniref:GGDEF domain-containing protein n=1 Tax=Azorhizobium doebereinerae TaxID=281091 RepID=UPI00040F0912|nr:GGDEF domain-containing protein [Azorhizobium doebereinerae]
MVNAPQYSGRHYLHIFLMETTIIRKTLTLIPAGIVAVFGFAFLLFWLLERRRRHLAILSAACLLFTLGACSQILHLPPGVNANAVVSAVFYSGSVLLTAAALLYRYERPLPTVAYLSALGLIVLAIFCFSYVHSDLTVRIYIQNVSYGVIFTYAVWRLRHLARGRGVDRLLFWILLLLGLHFFPRTLLTLGLAAPRGLAAFVNSAFWQTLQLCLALFGTSLALAILAATAVDIIEELRHERDLDVLTGLLNRRGFENRFAGATAQSAPGALILLDIDRFKRINDTFGHSAGDAVLREVGKVLRQAARCSECLGRLGGEEFAIFLPDALLPDAHVRAEAFRLAISSHSFPLPDQEMSVTASFGIAERLPHEDYHGLYSRVDRLLYAAKAGGRNRTASNHEATGQTLG